MSPYPWFRLYSEVIHDPKVLRMTPEARWAWVGLLCLASESKNRGVVQIIDGLGLTPKELAYLLDVQIETITQMLDVASALGMIECDEKGVITLLHWKERQYDKPSAQPERTRERKHAQRDRQAASRPSHAPVTPWSHPDHTLDTDSDTDTDPDDDDVVVVDGRATSSMISSQPPAPDPGTHQVRTEYVPGTGQVQHNRTEEKRNTLVVVEERAIPHILPESAPPEPEARPIAAAPPCVDEPSGSAAPMPSPPEQASAQMAPIAVRTRLPRPEWARSEFKRYPRERAPDDDDADECAPTAADEAPPDATGSPRSEAQRPKFKRYPRQWGQGENSAGRRLHAYAGEYDPDTGEERPPVEGRLLRLRIAPPPGDEGASRPSAPG